ncbi:Crp/Fnr family transcriptional regulator [Sphaerochaeta halotolerans]|jgi:CRP-like cAMP-binding protein|uniref:Crp/Fnr family transcriptional regulator n=1 Tax=Sphaerochaeta halotolerans TaxID=2293840 RepID=A0A372MLL9_9SPIR|nr:Crp/Fnr family transcriptional regulator [Sphaerochaeta halotolerans]MBG0766360.1 Crp/Fnr family transcriptional regulator [Spirochaetaceae bacterium]MXI86829.1 cyclic nucleotide-binding domain-containing protein [Sphaerochaeta halotolerans]RFU96206.1 Crp/Fnr family transcriptional regulator [Sphaerochaeta halotolerans]
MDILPLLENIWLFEDFGSELLASLFSEGGASLGSYSKGQMIYLSGEVCTTLDVVIEGTISVQSVDDEGKIFKVRVLEPGDVWGATLLFSRYNHYPMTVVSDDDSAVLHLPRALVLDLCEARVEFLSTLLNLVSDRAHELSMTVTKLSAESLRKSLLAYLQNLSRIQGSTTVVLPTSKKELAERLGFARTSLSRELASLVQEGILSYSGRRVELHISSQN